MALAANDVALLEAARANISLLTMTINHNGDALNVGLEGTSHGAVRVANGTTSNSVLTAEITNLRHEYDLPWARRSCARVYIAVR